MVLEKSIKLATRNLFDAAADVSAIPDRTPGQMLLQALTSQRLEADRGDSWATKMSQLPALEVKHPPQSDKTIFGLPDAETRGLLQRAMLVKAGMDGVYNMVLSRQERHEAAWGGYLERKAANGQSKAEALNATLQVFKAELGELDHAIWEVMHVLEDELLMKLELAEVEAVWGETAARLPASVAAVEELNVRLEGVEVAHREAMDETLYAMVLAMNDVAHIDPQQVARIVEAESMELNRGIIANRRSYADLIRRLQSAEVEKERERRARWEAAMQRWRVVRTHQLMDEYEARIKSPEFAEPPERLAIYAGLRSGQQATVARMCQHVETARSMVPPALHHAMAERWSGEAAAVVAEWYASLDGAVAGLQAHEEHVEQYSQQLLSELRSRVEALAGYTPEELAPMLEAQCVGAARQRRDAALQLLDLSDAFLLRQAHDWHRSIRAVSLFLQRLAQLYDTHKANWKHNEDTVHNDLSTARKQYNDQDAALEEGFSRAVTAVKQGYSENNLDNRVGEALHCLNLIENNYRAFHSTMVAIAQQYPRTVRNENDNYEVLLCTHLGVVPHAVMPLTEEQIREREAAKAAAEAAAAEATAAAEAAAAEAAAASKRGASRGAKSAAKPLTPEPVPVDVPEPEADTEPDVEPVDVGPPVSLPSGDNFDLRCDIYDEIHKYQAAQDEGGLASGLAAALEARRAAAEETARAEGGEFAIPPEELPKPRRTPALQALRDGLPPASNEEVPEGEAAEPPAEENPEADQEKVDTVTAPGPPLADNGEPHLLEIGIPRADVTDVLVDLRLQLLTEMEEFAGRTASDSKEWATVEVEEVTEELDENLRKHRPRAGRVEEDVRLQRSVELIGQRRKMETHIKSMNRNIWTQISDYKDEFRSLDEYYKAQIARIVEAERLLGTALSVKSLEIRKREAVALKAVIEKDMKKRAEALKETVALRCARNKDVNARFERDVVRGFEAGGRFAPETIAKFREKLTYNDLIIEEKMGEQHAEVDALLTTASEGLEGALLSLKRQMKPHRQDLTLIEAMDKAINAARRRADKCFEASGEMESEIASAIRDLDELTSQAAAASSDEGALDMCRDILARAEALRARLTERGLSLQWVASDGVKPVKLIFQVDAAGMADSKCPSAVAAKAVRDAAEAAAAPTKEDGKGGKGGKKGGEKKGGKKGGDKKDAAADEHAAVAVEEVAPEETMAAKIEAEIERSQAECAASVSEYYTTKNPERPITRPNRIPETAEELNAANAAILTGIREKMATVVEAARRELRIQTVLAYRLLPRVSVACFNTLMRHELKHASRVQDSLDAPYDAAFAQFQKAQRQSQDDLHPNLRDPNRVEELQALVDREAARKSSCVTRVKQHARCKVSKVLSQGADIDFRLHHLAAILTRLLDRFLLPDDLQPIPDGDDSLRAVELKNVKQLARLKLAEGEAEGWKATESEEAGRPYRRVEWAVARVAGSLQALGWGEEQWRWVELTEEAEVEGFERPEENEVSSATLTGLATPGHTHAVRALQAAVAELTSALKGIVRGCKETTAFRLSAEEQWAANWAGLLKHLHN